MPQFENIYGTNVHIPEFIDGTYIENWGTESVDEQYWRRIELPDFFEDVKLDADKNPILNEEQTKYALVEVDRCLNGFWFYNKGIKTYITGKNYFYLQWWVLEDGIYPDYRDADRRYLCI